MNLSRPTLPAEKRPTFEGLHPCFSAREATIQDLEEMRELFFKIFAEPDFNDPTKGFCLLTTMQARYRNDPTKHEREFFGRDKNRRYAIVVHERESGRLVGTAWLITDLDCEPSFDVGEINKIYLLPECRGKGLGLWLMQQMISQARVLGFRKLTLITGRERVRALSLYCKLGFKPALQHRYPGSPHTLAMVRDIAK